MSGWLIHIAVVLAWPSFQERAPAPADPVPAPMGPTRSDDEFRGPVDDELASEIAGLIDRLGSPVYRERDAATQRLIAIGTRAFPALRQAYRETKSLEVRLRIERIVHRAYFDYHVYSRNGFLGISMRPFVPGLNRKVPIPDGAAALLVADVIEHTGAQRAGLKKNDVIVAVDGAPVPGEGREIVDSFGQLIRAHPPGTEMSLTVIRGSTRLTIKATLGRCPENLARAGRVRGTSDLFRQTRARFPAWWSEHFRATGSPPAPAPVP